MPTPRALATKLLPLARDRHLEDVTIGPNQILATLEATAPRGTRPIYGAWSETIHSLYPRTIDDLPWDR